ncbi:MAG: helix-turn-helix domain-containing protein [Flavobacteriales bacterium]|nr:helix-turn-helix domain-containing protein [Flavobacteriales bacterium]
MGQGASAASLHPQRAPPHRQGGRRKAQARDYAITWELLRAGRSIAEVALERGLTEGTIQGHVARGIAAGNSPSMTSCPRPTAIASPRTWPTWTR